MNREEVAADVELITDGLGKRIDQNIKQVVISFRMAGLSTSGSCQGHMNWGYPYPWVEFYVDSKKENKRCRLIVERLLNQYSNSNLYIHDRGVNDAFRIQTLPALNISRLVLLRKEMDNFAAYVVESLEG